MIRRRQGEVGSSVSNIAVGNNRSHAVVSAHRPACTLVRRTHVNIEGLLPDTAAAAAGDLNRLIIGLN